MHPYLAKESYTYLVSSLYIMAFATRSGGRILHAQTYPLQEVDAEARRGGWALDTYYTVCVPSTVQLDVMHKRRG